MTAPTLAEVVAALEQLYPPQWADDWDAVGLVVGDPQRPVRSVLFAVDPAPAVVDQAVGGGVDLLVVHHPLLLRPVSSVAATTPKGAAVHSLITHGIALYTAHTNADSPARGVSAALAAALGVRDARPLVPDAEAVDRGSGRIGELERALPLREFADRVAAALPATAVGARVAGDLDQPVRTVAVAGGAGDFLLDAVARSGADVYVTSDLRHHPAAEFRERPGAPALIDIPHWAAEWTWLPVADDALRRALDERGLAVSTEVSRVRTDPWDHRTSGPARTPDPSA